MSARVEMAGRSATHDTPSLCVLLRAFFSLSFAFMSFVLTLQAEAIATLLILTIRNGREGRLVAWRRLKWPFDAFLAH